MTTATQQRAAILDHLSRYGTLTTLEARSGLDIMHPAARVMELRQQGKQIDT
ncbi:MAG: helix-turn-helix domain-containing protein, partial [Proteobacteria bacterium]|nr:helix-turn-helix domain-containing protein [Pseudomonadota bacterium]